MRNTHAAVNGKEPKTYNREQMTKWYNKLHSDSSEYKMWGNGIALPCAWFVMEGISEAIREQWECAPAPKITGRTAKEAYADMPEKLVEYIKAMPEYDEEIFRAVTGRNY